MIFRLLLFFSFLFAKEYYISFRFVSFNTTIYTQNFNCSSTLNHYKCNKKLLFKIEIKKQFDCNLYKEEIISNLLKDKIYFTSIEFKNNDYSLFKNVVTFTPQLFDIIIKDNIAYFYKCKE